MVTGGGCEQTKGLDILVELFTCSFCYFSQVVADNEEQEPPASNLQLSNC